MTIKAVKCLQCLCRRMDNNEYQKTVTKCPPQFPKGQCDIFRCLVLSNQQSQTPKILHHIKQTKVANPHPEEVLIFQNILSYERLYSIKLHYGKARIQYFWSLTCIGDQISGYL